ncbi:leucine-rich repeat : Leucine-rich repeat protein, putative OS=Trypanosoma vivax (strain Y486) GN=TvY486_0039050 PE=4 SV=1: Pkinase: LRR_4: LRR_4: LRR_4: LRR_4: LRR_4 [Gemmata massiliana]|uniref:Protein kinase domain-containing protein n=1 Tax=Gemmata massiliana TaxID=1210884 RepID=A0A6P2CXA2_9BACT|nr:leucine-rich repeat domain-containing protein [Gemmata massiliana]VTR93217.1 leucine-rich repeat : Leucine-rich repeat protein, putative OS=Trypanosoma vivax (strain Y486) GN=TvY486_0039050 PE=4 SV=1: Pkinase: LRR_4: LRR_4: LRR_4: LRR_4: LRR_4 [Gemmata massiliana]
MSEPMIPTEEEIAALPRWARVAFAVRCARRVLPLVRHFWPEAPEDRLSALACAVRDAGAAAAHATAAASSYAISYSAEAYPNSDDKDAFSPIAYAAADTVTDAARAAASEGKDVTFFAARATARAATAIRYALEASRVRDLITSEVRTDFDTLVWNARGAQWTDNTPVQPGVFGPLWPDGLPLGWPVDSEPVAPFARVEARSPTEAEIAQLPRWARVALAVRCARRVLPLFRHDWPAAPFEHIESVVQAVELAERLWAQAAAGFRGSNRAVAARAGRAAGIAYTAGAYIAVYVGDAAVNAVHAAGGDSIDKAYAAIAYAVDASAGFSPLARNAIRADFDALKRAMVERQWTYATTVLPDFFGPLWPDGLPPGWPVEDTPSEPANPQDDAQTVVPSPSRARRQREGAVGGPVFVPGDRVPHAEMWVLVELIGKGGFAQVWLARHRQTNESRAVKFCTHAVARERLPDVARHESNVASYVQQHTGTSAGCHPNIVPLYECNLRGEIPWLMYEFVPGKRSVANVIEDLQTLSAADRVARSVPLLHTIACAVGQFHRLERQIVHRDLTPKNVLMDGDVPRITDFGIGGAAVTAAVADATGLTEFTVRVDTMLRSAGTPPHASAQQLAGNAPDPRDDVYALGVMAYQMLTGELGAPGADARDKLEDLGVPDGVIRLIVKSVSDPSRRPKDAVEWAEVLVPLLSDRPAIARPLKRSVTVPGVWFSRPAADSNAEWERVGHSPCEITFAPDRAYQLSVSNQVADADLEGFRDLIDVLSFSLLTMSLCGAVTSVGLMHLSRLVALTSLDLSNCRSVADLSPLSGLTALTSLDLSNCRGVADFSPLSGLTALTSLDLGFCNRAMDLSPLSGLTALTSLYLNSNRIADLSPLSGLTALTNLDLNSNRIADLSPLSGLTALTSLDLGFCNRATDLAPLSGLTALTNLNLRNCGIMDLAPLSGLTALTNLNLQNCRGITDLAPLSGLTALTNLDLNSCKGLTDLAPLAGLTALTALNLGHCEQITDLTPLLSLTALTTLDLYYCDDKLALPDELQKRVKILR